MNLPEKTSDVDWQAVYQALHDRDPQYNRAAKGMSPGVKHLDFYQEWLLNPVVDLGSGSGDTVTHLRREGFEADGFDWVHIPECKWVQQADITKLLSLEHYRSAICVDVFEHIPDAGIVGLLDNLKQVLHQVITVCNDTSFWSPTGNRADDVDLHINCKPVDEWRTVLEARLTIDHERPISRVGHLFLCSQ